MSISSKGKPKLKPRPPMSEEQKKKISETLKKWYKSVDRTVN